MMLREKIIEQCLQAMKREDVKKELKQMFHPVIDMIMQEIYPYIYLSVVFVMISFLLTLSIFILMMRTSYFMPLPLPCMNGWMDAWMDECSRFRFKWVQNKCRRLATAALCENYSQ